MKKLLFIFVLSLLASPLWSSSIKFKAMDKYYDKELPIDSISVYDMNTGEEMLYLTDSIFFKTISSVEDIVNTNNLQLYPNPVEDILNINLSGIRGAELTISDISGRVHFRTTNLYSGQISLSVAGLPQGVYAIRSGDQSQTFIKNTTSNGQVVSLLSSSSMPSSLVKESKVQSQYDFRFTIYTEGFKPNIYYSKVITKDTLVELDMASLPSPFDGRHIKVELSINCNRRSYSKDRNGLKYSNLEFENYKFNYYDTLFVRNGKVDVKQGDYGPDYPFGDHKIQILRFEIDTVKETISNFYFLDSYRLSRRPYPNTLNLDYQSLSLHFNDISHYTTETRSKFIIYLKDVDTKVGYEKESTSVEYNAYEDTDGEELKEFIPEGSYIKIEIID